MHRSQLNNPQPPRWVGAWIRERSQLGLCQEVAKTAEGEVHHGVVAEAGLAFVTVRVPGASELGAQAFARQVVAAYRTAAEKLRRCEASRPLRWWNYLPDIRRRTEPGLDRYMHFNAGRYAALAEGLDQAGPGSGQALATASAVGHAGGDFIVHVLAGGACGTPLENPRQVPAYEYSSDYGPKPPCFARATAITQTGQVDQDGCVLLGGTASVVGQESRHPGDLPAQFDETCRNLAALIAHAKASDSLETWKLEAEQEAEQAMLGLISELRVYVVRPEDEPWIVHAIEQRFGQVQRLEVMHAPLCRADLLIEIEGLTQAGVFAKCSEPALRGFGKIC